MNDDRKTGGDSAPEPIGPPPAWRNGEVVLGGYVVERELAIRVGGVGRVYLACEPHTRAQLAIKRLREVNEARQRRFLRELMFWADLPPHPNLLPLRFFRTDRVEVFLFSDFAENGSLTEWIRAGGLGTLEQILDAAIQFAWGLHVAHEHGMVHQDVKPGNALITADGRLMVGDFGLAKSRAFLDEACDPVANPYASCGGMTRAYCSPEQYAGKDLTRATDVWSWGLSVLEAFGGACAYGPLAADALADLAANTTRMPDWVQALLRRCFAYEPEARWPTMAHVVEELLDGWLAEFGHQYPRSLAPVPPVPPPAPDERRTATGLRWGDPTDWLREALELSGRDPSEAATLTPPRGRTARARAMADMVIQHEAALLLHRAAEAGSARAEERLAVLCAYDRASVHERLDDRFGALPLYERAIATLERLVAAGKAELENELASAFTNHATVLDSLGRGAEALPKLDRAVVIRERRHAARPDEAEAAEDLARTRMNKAVVVRSLGDDRAALPLYDDAIGAFESLVGQGRPLHADLARARMNKANTLGKLGDGRAARPLFDAAIAAFEGLHAFDAADLAGDLATCYMNHAATLDAEDEVPEALRRYDRAIALCLPLADAGWADRLATIYHNKAALLQALHRHHEVLPLYDRAAAIYEGLIERDGRRELLGDLAGVRLYRLSSYRALRIKDEQLRPSVQSAVELLRHEQGRTGRADLASMLVWAERTFAGML